MKQNTLAAELYFSGIGLHTGLHADMKVCPAPENTGIRFQRVDIPGQPIVEALADYVMNTERGTVLFRDNVKVSTLEHLMAAFFGMGIDNALVQLSAPEVPILDGSALPFVEAFMHAGTLAQQAERKYITIKTPVHYSDPVTGTKIDVLPADNFELNVTIDFNSEILGRQKAIYTSDTDFATEIASCRTFVFLHEVLFLYRHNLVKGGDLDNALVIAEKEVSEADMALLRQIFNKPQLSVHKGYMNHLGLRFPNECARHKTLDMIGDLMLAGTHFNAHIHAYKPGHKANIEVAGKIREQMNL